MYNGIYLSVLLQAVFRVVRIMKEENFKGHIAMAGANVFWGAMPPAAKIAMVGGGIAPIVVTDLRFFGAMVLFWLISLFCKKEPVEPKDMMRLFGAAMLAIVLNQGCFIFGVKLTSPVDASIIATSMPLIAMVLSAFFLKEPVSGKKVTGIALGATGALLLIAGSSYQGSAPSGNGNPILGDVLVLLAQCSYALYFVLFKGFVSKYSIITIMKWMFTYSFLCALPFSYNELMGTEWLEMAPEVIASLAVVVVGGTFISYLLVIVGQRNLRPTVGAMYNYVQPVISCSVAVFMGMDTLNFPKLASVLLIAAGVYLVSASPTRKEMEEKLMKEG